MVDIVGVAAFWTAVPYVAMSKTKTAGMRGISERKSTVK